MGAVLFFCKNRNSRQGAGITLAKRIERSHYVYKRSLLFFILKGDKK